ncbi:MAG: hypothetical protein KatS3mg014_0531 [Actinomycetota bacterium]|nr:MAG: hypothetical protein KatS3mg014_0531 [Actinomycetota bacterium]
MRRDTLLYGGAIVLFGGVVLWAAQAPGQVIALAVVLAVALLLAAALALRPEATLLIVGERPGEDLEPVRRVAEGYRVLRCPGPSDGPCPVLLGRPCPAGPEPAAALVVRHADERGPLAPCGQALSIPEVVIEEGSDRELEIQGRYARLGLDRGTEELDRALDRMLGRRAA